MQLQALTHAAQREPILSLMKRVWEVSVKFGSEGQPQEKALAGDLALGTYL